MSKFVEEQEIPKYKKKSKAKGLKRSKHKHEYKPCLVHLEEEIPSINEPSGKRKVDSYFYAEYCTICGKLTNPKFIEGKPLEERPEYSVMLTNEEIKEKYKDLEVKEVQDYFQKYVSV